MADIHDTVSSGIMGEVHGGIFSNPLFVGVVTPGTKYGRVHSLPSEIAGHHIVYAISENERLEVRAVPLQHYAEGDKNSAFDASDFMVAKPRYQHSVGPTTPGTHATRHIQIKQPLDVPSAPDASMVCTGPVFRAVRPEPNSCCKTVWGNHASLL